jgi:hypothetical protein
MSGKIPISDDGTGQIGGLRHDQRISDVCRKYRAMRPGPSSPISWRDGAACYDPGPGVGETDGFTASTIAGGLEAPVGAGIEENMIDCCSQVVGYPQARAFSGGTCGPADRQGPQTP